MANYPGHLEGTALFADSQNNLWLFGGYFNTYLNTVWHFNTTSLMWTWVWGEVATRVNINFDTNYWNGRYAAGGFIDDEDRVWLFGGFGSGPEDDRQWSDMWSFDTKTLEWRVEWGNESNYANLGSIVSVDFDPGNQPSSRYGAQMIDRFDGTFMIYGGFEINSKYCNDVWLFNKTSKLWKNVYGVIDQSEPLSEYTHYREAGSVLGARRSYGAPSRNHRGHFILNGGYTWSVARDYSNTPLNDIWVIPQDQCLVFNDCDANAACTTDMWTLTCTCNDGYAGDGRTCTLSPVSSPSAPVADTPVASTPSAAPKAATSNAARGVVAGSAVVALSGLVALVI